MNTIIGWIVNKVKDYVIANWKTTLTGLIGGILSQVPALAPYKEQILAFALMLIGLVAKDGDKTGTTAQPRTAPGVVAAQNASAAGGGTGFVFTPLADAERPPG